MYVMKINLDYYGKFVFFLNTIQKQKAGFKLDKFFPSKETWWSDPELIIESIDLLKHLRVLYPRYWFILDGDVAGMEKYNDSACFPYQSSLY